MDNNKEFKRYTVTSALPYANGPLHIGHLTGAYLPADIYVRYLRLKGKDVVYIGGSDEHGVPITLRAKKEGITPQQVVDKYHEMNKKTFENFGISFDQYHRTSAELHHETASEFFTTMYDKGEFVEKESDQYYDESQQQFLADRYITGTCPNCDYDSAYGDQCENCGISLSPKELINPRSAISGDAPILKKTTHWYLPLDKYQDQWLEEWLKGHKKDWKPNVIGQCSSWLDTGLKPRAVTRDLSWGVEVPLKQAAGKVLYVWFDAPIGYISSTKQWAKDNGKDWELYWKDEDTKLVHFIGKDNIVFHCIIFPAMLKAEGSYILPDNVPANEFLNLEGDKLSTSRDHAVWVDDYMNDFPDSQDVLRYVLCATMPETKDNDFKWKDFQAKNNNELVAILGNFVNRTMVLIDKYYEGKVPDPIEMDSSLKEQLDKASKSLEENMENFNFRQALSAMMEPARIGNKFLTENEPWKLIKTDPEGTKRILRISLDIICRLSAYMIPFLPKTSEKLKVMLNVDDTITFENIPDLKAGHQLGKAELLFAKIDDETIDKQIQKLTMTNQVNQTTEATPSISFDDFSKMEIKVGTIEEAEKVKGADKLLKLNVNLGFEVRTVVSGIAEYYSPEEVIGKQVSLIVNLAPRTIRGVESQGMVLMAENEEGKLTFVSPQDPMPNGAVIR
ncbi:MAG: methionine--tRNA ligase [Bacteroidetes bacterium]|nr:methionine--tRNA ligase [Bacteroidota bacterium]